MNIQARRASVCGLGLVTAGLVAGCDTATENEVIDADVPPAARIGNVATADLNPVGDSNVTGTVTFAEVGDALMIDATVTGLGTGEHGLHLHENGDCSAPDASSAGGHFSPDDDPHGAPSDAPGQHHAGDLGNLLVGADGSATLMIEDEELALIGEYGVVGRAVIVHRSADDLSSQPSGDAGGRIACGVIEWGPDVEPE